MENKKYEASDLFDESIITRLFAGNKGMFLRIADIFVKKGEQNIADIKKMLGDNDIHNYTISVHGVKGAAGNLGLTALAGISQELEFVGKANDLDKINANMQEFEDTYLATIAFINEYKNN